MASTGKFPYDLKQYLKACHPDCQQELQREEDKQKEQKTLQKHKTLGQYWTHKWSEDSRGSVSMKILKESHKNQEITCKMAMFTGSCTVPISIVENEEFQSRVKALDPCYAVPGRT